MDTKYIKGMINNPDLQPNMTINQWITGILLFHFKMCHITADRHTGPDGLSCRPPANTDPPEDDNFKDWLDDSYFFCVTLLNDRTLSFITVPYFPHTGPYAIPGASLFSRTPDLLLLPSPLPCYHLTYSSVFVSSVEPDLELDSPVISWSTKAIAKEARIRLIQDFLNTCLHPADLSNADFQSFVNLATKFFVLHDSLWCHESHGRHQLVVPEHRRYGLIKEAHDDLGHKGVFTVRTCLLLLLHFWWPMLVDDMKWFVRTCHECQIRQTQRLHIPPTVLVIGGLFRKAHLDTMVMPWSAGYWYIVQAHCTLTAYPEWRMLRFENTAALIFYF